MTIFTKTKELTSKLAKVEKDLSDKIALVTQLENENNSLKTKLQEVESKASNHVTVEEFNALKSSNAELLENIKSLNSTIKALEVENQEVDEKASNKALEIVANTGVEPIVLKTDVRTNQEKPKFIVTDHTK